MPLFRDNLVPRTELQQIIIKRTLKDLQGHWFRWSRYQLTKEQALKVLQRMTGQDFGYDVKAWRKWFDENPDTELKI
jgi:hypothetical protein